MAESVLVGLVLASIWLGGLTLVVVLLVRQIGLLTIRFDQLDLADPGFKPESDGLSIGQAIPPEVAAVLPELATSSTYLLLLSATCTPCRDLAAGLRRMRFESTKNVVTLVPGREALADSLIAMLPSGMRTIRDPAATAVARGLHFEGAPFALFTQDGAVAAKAHLGLLRRPADIVAFINDNGHSDFSEIRDMEVIGHVG